MPGGQRRAEGEIFKNPALAKTLRLLATKGRDAYYKGRSPRRSCAYSNANGGFFAMEDFAKHHSTWDAPISTDLPRRHRVGAAAQRPGARGARRC